MLPPLLEGQLKSHAIRYVVVSDDCLTLGPDPFTARWSGQESSRYYLLEVKRSS